MILFLRSLLYNILFFGLTCPLLIIFSPALLLPAKIANFISSSWCWLNILFLKAICNLNYQLIGMDNIPKNISTHPVIFASKHQSTWETLALIIILNGPVFILKKELLNIPFFGGFLKKAGMIPIDRGSGVSSLKKAIEEAKDRLQKGRSIIIFPEGRRSRLGENLKYQRGIVVLYEHLNVPVIPIALNSGLFWPRKSFIKKPGTITVEFFPPIPPNLDRNRFMKILEDTIETNSTRLADLKNIL